VLRAKNSDGVIKVGNRPPIIKCGEMIADFCATNRAIGHELSNFVPNVLGYPA
jgi:hypothetical protein